LGGKSKQQLLNMIEEKGNNRKQALHQSTKEQTQDWQNTRATKDAIEEQIKRI